jgi:hypothetical protein
MLKEVRKVGGVRRSLVKHVNRKPDRDASANQKPPGGTW